MNPAHAVFADAFYWVALLNPKDHFHSEALGVSASLQASVILTTEEVLAEVLAYFLWHGRQPREQAVRAARDILSDPTTRVVPQSHASFLAGLGLYEARLDKGYSLTDCISMSTMKAETITDVLTNDRHFEQEGLNVLFK